VRQHRVSAFDFERRLIDLVERVAVDYETHVGIGPIVQAVHQARETVEAMNVDAADGGLALIERHTRQHLETLASERAVAAAS
jgi:hypothetical protein